MRHRVVETPSLNHRSLLWSALVALMLVGAFGCASSKPASAQPQVAQPEVMHGLASWYGQEFAGRTTANGEIFDPLLMTAAHRTLPFGTIVEVTNPKTNQTVSVRINDRGPYVGNRLIDLSYGAAQQISLVDPGSGEVDVKVIRIGRGDREPPAPYSVTVAEPRSGAAPPEVPSVEMPAPAPTTPQPQPAPVTVDHIDVVEEHAGVESRRQVAPGGTTIETVPVPQTAPAPTTPTPSPAPAPAPRTTREVPSAPGHSAAANLDASRRAPAPQPRVTQRGKFIVQVGAFSQEPNAKELQEKVKKTGQDAWIDHTSLYHVRIGPFDTREQAIKSRERLESAGISAIVIVQ